MGLDMYAYKIKAALIDNDPAALATGVRWTTDVPVHKIARRCVGFLELSKEQVQSLSEDDQNKYVDDASEATCDAEAKGYVDFHFYYWRKFNALHGWMEDLYRAKGGTSEFNCATLRIDAEDLDKLEADMNSGKLVPRTGFFFGAQELDPGDIEDLNDFIGKARQAIADGYAVIYDSWW